MTEKILIFSAKPYDLESFRIANARFGFIIEGVEAKLTEQTAALAAGYDSVCAFVNDTLDRTVLSALKEHGVKIIALRCAGYNHVDLKAAEALGLAVVRVPTYSPRAVAEHALALLIALSRKTHKAYNRVREGNFSLNGLMGFDLYGKTVGVIGTGQIGQAFAEIMKGIGCSVIVHDLYPNLEWAKNLRIDYADLDTLYARAKIISLHCPLTPENHHMIGKTAFGKMQDGTFLINTGRGGLIDTAAAIEALKSGRLGALGLDVYEGEKELFFDDHSSRIIHDDIFSRLLTFPNVIITGHQAFLTEEALNNIATTTLENIRAVLSQQECKNRLAA